MLVQVHGLQLRAMTKGVGEMLGRLLADVLNVKSDYDGAALGRCARIRANVDVNKPLYRWTTVNIEGVSCRIFFGTKRWWTFVSFVEDSTTKTESVFTYPPPPNGKKYYGPWLRASGQNPILISEIAAKLDRLNTMLLDQPLEHSPKTPASKNMELIPQQKPNPQKQKMKGRQLSSIPIGNFSAEGPPVSRSKRYRTPVAPKPWAWISLIGKP